MFALWRPRVSFFRSSSFPTFALRTRSVARGNRLSRPEKFQTGEREKRICTYIRANISLSFLIEVSDRRCAFMSESGLSLSLFPYVENLLRSDFASRKLLIDGFCAVKSPRHIVVASWVSFPSASSRARHADRYVKRDALYYVLPRKCNRRKPVCEFV